MPGRHDGVIRADASPQRMRPWGRARYFPPIGYAPRADTGSAVAGGRPCGGAAGRPMSALAWHVLRSTPAPGSRRLRPPNADYRHPGKRSDRGANWSAVSFGAPRRRDSAHFDRPRPLIIRTSTAHTNAHVLPGFRSPQDDRRYRGSARIGINPLSRCLRHGFSARVENP